MTIYDEETGDFIDSLSQIRLRVLEMLARQDYIHNLPALLDAARRTEKYLYEGVQVNVG